MKDTKEALKTLGEKPESFAFTFDDGTSGRFYIGSEVSLKLNESFLHLLINFISFLS